MGDKKEEELLSQQIFEIMNEDQSEREPREQVEEERQRRQQTPLKSRKKKSNKKKKRMFLRAAGFTILVLLIIVASVLGTKPGRRIIYKTAGEFIYKNIDNEDLIKAYEEKGGNDIKGVRQEDHVTNYLLFGIEEFGGARNTDSIMIVSINTNDNTLKLTSLLRDSYVDIPNHKAHKLNSAYARGGARLLVDTVELNYKVKIDGYVSVGFEAFENIVDLLGGVTIELGEEEAKYLNKTNYISRKSNRDVTSGVNHMNGNQVMGYCRIRKVKTLGGANNDYGRIVRQQRALSAMFDSFKTPKNLFRIVPITKEGLGYVTTNLTQIQIEKAMEAMVENKIVSLDTFRVPVDGKFDAPKKYNGIGYPIVLDWESNRIELYQFIYGDTKEEAKAVLANISAR